MHDNRLDYHHPGVNNNFLHATLDGLAIRYNGISVGLLLSLSLKFADS